MKIIEALKKIKDLTKKTDDLIDKISKHCADMDYENPVYPDQKGQVAAWLQSHRDILKEISRLRYCIQKTNLLTKVAITFGDYSVEKSIAEWIHRRRDLAEMEMKAWKVLGDKNLRDAKIQFTNQVVDAKVRRYYDPKERDNKLSQLQSEPSLIDGRLEVINAVTDLIEE